MIHAIVYSKTTGRVRHVVDPEINVPNVVAFLAQIPLTAGEAVIVYTKTGADNIIAWQAAVNQVTGKSVAVGVDAGDTYAEVDGQNHILSIHVADPASGDVGPNGGTLVLAPAGCSMNWTYNGTTFSPPVFATKSAKVA
ncbi:MAG: hypothetical protein ACYDAE_23150 [Steroidobacteraceae bacterium]